MSSTDQPETPDEDQEEVVASLNAERDANAADAAATADAVAAMNTPANETTFQKAKREHEEDLAVEAERIRKDPGAGPGASVLIRYRRIIVEHNTETPSFSVASLNGDDRNVRDAPKLGPFATLQDAELALLTQDLAAGRAVVVMLSEPELGELHKIIEDEDNEIGSINDAIHAGVTAVLSALGPLKDQLEAAIAQQAAAGGALPPPGEIVKIPAEVMPPPAPIESPADAAKRVAAAAMQPCGACGKTSVPFVQLGQIAACVECDRKWLRIENGLVEAPASADVVTDKGDCTCGHSAVFHGMTGLIGTTPGPCVYAAHDLTPQGNQVEIVYCDCKNYAPRVLA